MMETYPTTVQRPALLEFAKALCSRENALRRDECGDWCIKGDNGWIYAIPGGFQFVVGTDGREAPQAWTYAKRALSFARLTQDGDFDGTLILDRLPTEEEAPIIRRTLGIAKRRELSEEQLAAMRQALDVWHGSVKKTALDECPARVVPEEV